MSIRSKTLLLVTITFFTLLGVLVGTSRYLVLNSFMKLEEKNTLRNINRVQGELANIQAHLDALTVDWADWNESYKFTQGKNEKYIEDKFSTDNVLVISS